MADSESDLQVGHIVAIACSGVLVLVVIAVVSLIFVYVYHRKLFCFKRRAVVRRPKIYTEEEIEKGLSRKRRLQVRTSGSLDEGFMDGLVLSMQVWDTLLSTCMAVLSGCHYCRKFPSVVLSYQPPLLLICSF